MGVLIRYGFLPLAAVLLFGSAFAATYDYDELNRLKAVFYANGASLSYSYDAAGNMTQFVTTGPSTPVDGACGSADGQLFATPPAADLCTAGTAGSMSGSGPWSWTCLGAAGGADAACGAGLDSDRDGIEEALDNCPTVVNASQSDVNANGIGDACDPADSDGDRYSDMLEVAMGGDPNDSLSLPTTQEAVSLQAGWNLVSIPLSKVWYTGAAPTVPLADGVVAEPVASLDALLSSLAGKYIQVRAFDPAGTKTYSPTAPAFANSLKYMAGGYGYWINATEPVDLVLEGPPMLKTDSLSLQAGWNLVSYWGDDVPYVGTAPTANFPAGTVFTPVASLSEPLAALGSTLVQVRSFDGTATRTFSPTAPAFANSLKYLGPGYGYWINLNADAVLHFGE